MAYIRLALYEPLIGPIDIRRWPTYARRIPAAVVTDCRGVYGALARSEGSCLGLKDRKSGMETLSVKQSLIKDIANLDVVENTTEPCVWTFRTGDLGE